GVGVGAGGAGGGGGPFRVPVVGDDVDDLLFRREGEICHRAVDRLPVDLGRLFHRQLLLLFVRAGRFFVALDELAAEPAEDVIRNRGGLADIRVFRATGGV